MDIQHQKHPFNYQQQVKMSKELSQELVHQKRRFKQLEGDKDRWRNDLSIRQVYILSTKFLNQWKKFTNYQNLNVYPENGKSPGLKNHNLIKQIYNFGECSLENGIRENQHYIIVTKEVAAIFQKYNGTDIMRKLFIINGYTQVDLYPKQVEIIFISYNWFNIAYKNSLIKIPKYEVLAYKKQKVFQFAQRVAKYSKQDGRNMLYQQFRLWRCSKMIDLDNYAAQIKQIIKFKQIDENKQNYMNSEGQLIENKIMFQDAGQAALFIVQLKQQEKSWVYRQIKNKSSSQKPIQAQAQCPITEKPTKDKQTQYKMAIPEQQLKQCKYCKQKRISMPLVCSTCSTVNYCSAACLDSDKFYHKPVCLKNFNNEIQTKIDNDISAPPSKQDSYFIKPWGAQPPNKNQYQDQKINFKMQNASKKGVVGLCNLGNTCYMNSALQCLSHSIDLTNYFINQHYEKQINTKNPIGSQGKVVRQYARLLQNLWAGTYSKYKPERFKDTIGLANIMFEGYMQHDSQEFLAFLLDTIHEDLNRVMNKPPTQSVDSDGRSDQVVARESWLNHLRRNQSIVTDLFGGQFKSRVTCPNCNLHSLTFDPYFCIPLPLPEEGVEQIILYFFRANYRGQTKKIIIKCITNSVKEVFAAVQKVTDVPFSRLKLIVSGFNGMVRQVAPQDTVKRLVNQKNLSQLAQQKQLFACEFDEQQLAGQKKFLIFKFLNKRQNAITFKRMFPFKIDNSLMGSALFDRICKFVSKIWPNHIQETALRQLTKKGDAFKIFLRYGNMKVEKNKVLFKNQVQILEDTSIKKYYQLSSGEMEFQIHFNHNQKMNFNVFVTHKLDDHNPKFQMKTKFTIDECLKHFALTQILQEDNQWFCPSCRQFVIAEKQMQIYKCPKYLIFQIKRFKQKLHEKVKSNVKVDYPVELDMSPYVMSQTLPETYYLNKQGTEFIVTPEYDKERKIKESQNCKYELYGIVNHYGSLQGGHYIAKAKNNGIWYKFNDDYVTNLNSSQIVEAQAYLLFYKRID